MQKVGRLRLPPPPWRNHSIAAFLSPREKRWLSRPGLSENSQFE
ncbi:hypothetical protein ACFOHY_12170 [Rhizobium rosettiformans]